MADKVGRVADKVVDEVTHRVHRSADKVADFISDLKDESNSALCRQCPSFQQCQERVRFLEREVASCEDTCVVDGSMVRLRRELEVMANRTKQLELEKSIERMRSEDKIIRCEKELQAVKNRTKKLELESSIERMRSEEKQFREDSLVCRKCEAELEGVHEENSNLRKKMARNEMEKSVGRKCDSAEVNEMLTRIQTLVEESTEKLRSEQGARNRERSEPSGMGDDNWDVQHVHTLLSTQVFTLNKEKQELVLELQLLKDEIHRAKDTLHSLKEDIVDTNSRLNLRLREDEDSSRVPPEVILAGRKGADKATLIEPWSSCANLLISQEAKLESCEREIEECKHNATRTADSTAHSSNYCANPQGRSSATPPTLVWILVLIISLPGFGFCAGYFNCSYNTMGGAGAQSRVIDAAERFIRKRARVIELKGKLGLPEHSDAGSMAAFQAQIKVLHKKSEIAASALAAEINAAKASGAPATRTKVTSATDSPSDEGAGFDRSTVVLGRDYTGSVSDCGERIVSCKVESECASPSLFSRSSDGRGDTEWSADAHEVGPMKSDVDFTRKGCESESVDYSEEEFEHSAESEWGGSAEGAESKAVLVDSLTKVLGESTIEEEEEEHGETLTNNNNIAARSEHGGCAAEERPPRSAREAIAQVQGTLALLFPQVLGAGDDEDREDEEDEEETRRRMDQSTLANGWSIIDADDLGR